MTCGCPHPLSTCESIADPNNVEHHASERPSCCKRAQGLNRNGQRGPQNSHNEATSRLEVFASLREQTEPDEGLFNTLQLSKRNRNKSAPLSDRIRAENQSRPGGGASQKTHPATIQKNKQTGSTLYYLVALADKRPEQPKFPHAARKTQN